MSRRKASQRRSAILRQAVRPRLIEPLEKRVLLASDLLTGMAQELLVHVQELRDDVGATFDDATEVLSQVPVVGPQIAEAAAFLDDLGEDLQQAIEALADDAGEQELEDLLNSFDAISNAEVTLSSDTVSVNMDLGHTVQIFDLGLDFDIGLRSLPIYVQGEGGIVGELSFSYQNLGFTYHDPGEGGDPVFTPDFDDDEVSIGVSAGLSEDASITATLGFLHGTVTDAAAPGLDTGVAASLTLDATAGGVGILDISGSAMVALDLTVDIGNAFPDVKATFILDWSNLQQAPEASFQDVRVSLDGAVARILSPLVNALEPVFTAMEPITNVLTEPLPVLDEIGIDVNLIGLAEGVLQLAGDAIPSNYRAYIEAFITVVQVIDFIEMFESDGTGSGFDINFGNFEFTGETESDLRFVDPRNPITSDELSALAVAGGITFDIDLLQEAIENNLPPQIAGPLNDVIDRFSMGVDFSVPLLNDPVNAIFPLLLGRDATLMELSIFYESPPPEDSDFGFDAAFPLGLDGGFEVSINAGIDLELGVDTFGLRSFIQSDFQDPQRLLDGFYIRDGSRIHLGGELVAFISAAAVVFSVEVEGGLAANFEIEARAPENPADEVDNNPDTVRLYSELIDCFLYASGSADVFMNLIVKFGVELPVIGFVGYSKEFKLAEKTLFEISGCLIDPFNPPDVVLAEYDEVTGDLLLNLGSQARRDARNFEVDHVDEIFVVGVQDGQVTVSAFGLTQLYPMPQRIVAHGDSGNDIIRIEEGVNVEAELLGGGGDDRLEYLGSGTVMMDGGNGEDFLLSRAASSHLIGGGSDDILISELGTILNLLEGGSGNDLLVGGTGAGQLLGGAGNDTLEAGTAGDLLEGGDDDDLFILGAGQDTALGGEGDDVFQWDAGDGSDEIDGGGGSDMFGMQGTDLEDLFDVTIHFGEVSIEALCAGFDPAQVDVVRVEHLSLDGLLGEDSVAVTPVQEIPPTPDTGSVDTVLINSADMQNPDAAVDHVDVFGTTNDDRVTVEQLDVTIFDLSEENDSPVTGSPRAAMMRIARIHTYEVITTNVADDLLVDMRDQDDTIVVLSVTGPTALTGNAGDDAVIVHAQFLPGGAALGDYPVGVEVFDDSGINQLIVDLSDAGGATSTVETLVTDASVSSQVIPDVGDPTTLLPWANYTPGAVTGGLLVVGSFFTDTVNVASTLPAVNTRIFGNDGNDDINLSSVFELPGGHLDGIRGPVGVDGGAGSNALTLVDVLATGGNQNVLVAGNAVTGFAGPLDDTPVFFDATGGTIVVQLWGSASPGLLERYTIINPAAPVNIEDNEGDSLTHVHATAHEILISGGPGRDEVHVASAPDSLDGITASIHVIGGAGVDAAFAFDRLAPLGTSYALHDDRLVRGFAQLHFDTTLERLGVETSQLADTVFVFSTPASTFVGLNQNGGNDALFGPNAPSTWRINGANAGVLNGRIAFNSSETLIGGIFNNHFAIEPGGSIQSIVGGFAAGVDTLDYSRYSQHVFVSYAGAMPTGTAVGSFLGIEQLIGTAKTKDLLVGPAAATTFDITGQDAGAFTTGGGPVAFVSFENLTGGPSNDTFRVAETGSLSGNITGAGGQNVIDYTPSTSAVVIELNKQRASRIKGKLFDIRHAIGGSGDDLIVGDDDNNVLAGGPGNDVLVGRGGADVLFGQDDRDILIGGAGGDALLGGDGEDILIGGTTAHDNSLKSLARLMDEWKRPDLGYAARIDNLRNGGGLNLDVLLNAGTVFNDGAADALTGGAGLDWFWADPAEDTLIDFGGGEQLN